MVKPNPRIAFIGHTDAELMPQSGCDRPYANDETMNDRRCHIRDIRTLSPSTSGARHARAAGGESLTGYILSWLAHYAITKHRIGGHGTEENGNNRYKEPRTSTSEPSSPKSFLRDDNIDSGTGSEMQTIQRGKRHHHYHAKPSNV